MKLKGVIKMSVTVKLSNKIVKAAEENPDLSYNFIKDTLMALEEVKQGEMEEYVFDS